MSHQPNRLAQESSPYLFQHAHNPVDWWPWGPAAFAEARRRDVPIFLSIGYSTCYWCHVMERECFENAEIAAQMNAAFVCIKLDREERPDVDELYMAATVMMTGHGGWPMSVFMEPATLRPYYCGTYFPPAPRHGIPDFPTVLESMSRAWKEQREGVTRQATAVADAVIADLSAKDEAAELGQRPVTDAVSLLLRAFDRANGGFGPAPKFPQPMTLELLLDARGEAADDSTSDAIDIAVRKTLDAMLIGGIRDHAGGGFHRYAVDATWTVPHFEKMLYDQAQLGALYARAARYYGDAEYARVARELFAYVLRELTNDRGGFYSAQDAEVNGREGVNYLWTAEQVRAALGDDADFAVRAYALDAGPNFRDPHHPDEPSGNVLRFRERPEKLAAAMQTAPATFTERLEAANAALLAVRAARPAPRLDDKTIVSWNGLMISAFARASRDLDTPSYLAAAERAADFILANLRDKDGNLLRSWRAGAAKTPALLEDYACFIQGLLDIARVQDGPTRQRRLDQARALLVRAERAFFDQGGAVYDTRADEPDLFVRARSTHDGAMPSGFSAITHALIDLSELTGDNIHAARALAALASQSGQITRAPVNTVNSTRALLRLLLRAELEPGDDTPGADAPSDLVQVFAGVERVEVDTHKPVTVTLRVRIAPGWHVPAAEPGDAALAPFRIDITGGSGVRAYADYPAGKTFGDPPIRVYEGELEIRVVLEREGAWSGRPLLTVHYQPCSDRACLEPVTLELDIALDPK